MDVVVGAGEAGADAIGKQAVVVVGPAVDHDVADEPTDGGAGLRGDGSWGGCGLREGAGGDEGCGKKEVAKAHFRTVSQGRVQG